MHQLRFGCGNESCQAPTCFTSRSRAAGRKPLRRYNKPAARALAVHLASQSNPETHLCRLPNKLGSSKIVDSTFGQRRKPSLSDDSAARSLSHGAPTFGAVRSSQQDATVDEVQPYLTVDSALPTNDDELSRPTQISLRKNDEPSKIDSKSFVQNLFNTASFRFFEWLAPRKLDTIARDTMDSQHNRATQPHEVSQSQDGITVDELTRTCSSGSESDSRMEEESRNTSASRAPSEASLHAQTMPSEARAVLIEDAIPPLNIDERRRDSLSAATHNASGLSFRPHARTRRKLHVDKFAGVPTAPKIHRCLSKTPRESDPTVQKIESALNIMKDQRNPLTSAVTSTAAMKEGHKSLPIEPDGRNVNTTYIHTQKPLSERQSTCTQEMQPRERAQALTIFNKETLDLLSVMMLDIIRPNDRDEFKSLKYPDTESIFLELDSQRAKVSKHHKPFYGPYNNPSEVYRSSIEHCAGKHYATTRRTLVEQTVEEVMREDAAPDDFVNARGIYYITDLLPVTEAKLALRDETLSRQWRTFIDQSAFFILSSRHLVSISFHDDDLNAFDSQLTYHYLRLLLHFSYEPVVEALWTVAECLFMPPANIAEIVYRKRLAAKVSGMTCEDLEASSLIQLCLHALTALVPAVSNWQAFYNVSRIRAEGNTIDSRLESRSYLSTLTAYHDVMSNDLALRLAKRIFAAVAVRLRLHYLSSRQCEMKSCTGQDKSQDDIVTSMVLSRLIDGKGATEAGDGFDKDSRELYYSVAPGLIYDWALTVIMSDWDGSPVVDAESAVGGALAVIAALHSRRVELSLVDGLFVAKVLEQKLDQLAAPVHWLKSATNPKHTHLLDHPYLFSSETRITFFRAINFYSMNNAFATSTNMFNTVGHVSAPHMLMTDPSRREHLEKRLKTALDTLLVLNVRRGHLLEDAFDQLWRRERRELARPLKVCIDEGDAEQGYDSGGVQQEFVRLAIAEALKPDAGMFTVDSRTHMIWFQPSSPQHAWKFELIGLIMSLAIYNGLNLPVTFPKAMYIKLLGKVPSNISHIVDGWPELAKSLDALLEWNESELGSIEEVLCRTYEFSTSLFEEHLTREMVPNTMWPQYTEIFGVNRSKAVSSGSDVRMVDASNRDEYVSDYINWLTNVSIAPQFEAFKKGFFTCLNTKSLTLFTPSLLAMVAEGKSEISIAELRLHAQYEGYSPMEPYIQAFWDIVSKYDDEGKRRLLEFVTASDRVPAGGYAQVNFRIMRNGDGGMEQRLPTAYTCYGNLLLPKYSSTDILAQKLEWAIRQAYEGFGFA